MEPYYGDMSERKTRVREALQHEGQTRGDDALESAVLTKYVAVTEWMAPDGERWLAITAGDAADQDLQRWDVQGMFFNVLHDPAWQRGSDD